MSDESVVYAHLLLQESLEKEKALARLADCEQRLQKTKDELQALRDQVAAEESAEVAVEASRKEAAAQSAAALSKAHADIENERALRQSAESRAAAAETRASADHAALLASESRGQSSVDLSPIMAALNAHSAPAPAKKNMRVVVGERDGNGDIRTFLIKHD
tara:strand:- start:479 stop:964 length:486 start_codon:yes stop_codon:yes gene_type:complete